MPAINFKEPWWAFFLGRFAGVQTRRKPPGLSDFGENVSYIAAILKMNGRVSAYAEGEVICIAFHIPTILGWTDSLQVRIDDFVDNTIEEYARIYIESIVSCHAIFVTDKVRNKAMEIMNAAKT